MLSADHCNAQIMYPLTVALLIANGLSGLSLIILVLHERGVPRPMLPAYARGTIEGENVGAAEGNALENSQPSTREGEEG